MPTRLERRIDSGTATVALRRRAGFVMLALAITVAAGCGDKSDNAATTSATAAARRTVDDQKVEQGIESSLSTSSTKVTSAKCPSDVPVQVGDTFTCSVTFSNDATGKVTVTQKAGGRYSYTLEPGSVQIPGSAVDAQVEQALAAEGIDNATVTCPENIIVKTGTTVTCDVSGAQGLAGGTVTFSFSNDDGEVDSSSVKSG